MATEKRSYNDLCAAAHALDLVGERWTLLVIRELMLGPKRFSDIRAGLPGVSANVLTQRLEKLEAIGAARRRTLPPPASTQVYELTEWGLEAEPIFQALGRWGARSPFHGGEAFSVASLILSLRTMFNPDRAGAARLRLGLVCGLESFVVEVGDGRLTAERGEICDVDARLTGDPTAIAGWAHAGAPLEALEAAGAIAFEGDRAAADQLPAFLDKPTKAGDA